MSKLLCHLVTIHSRHRQIDRRQTERQHIMTIAEDRIFENPPGRVRKKTRTYGNPMFGLVNLLVLKALLSNSAIIKYLNSIHQPLLRMHSSATMQYPVQVLL